MIITRPTLLLDENVCRENIRRITSKFQNQNITVRPHFKTHQSAHAGRWFRDYGVDRITVSSMTMASCFANDEWKNITVAFPVNPFDYEIINDIAKRTSLNICVVDKLAVEELGVHLTNNVGVFIEIDNGYHRTGVNPEDYPVIDGIIKAILSDSHMTFMGFLSHAGHSYKCRSRECIQEVHERTTDVMRKLAVRYRPEFPELIISTGDTPTCSVAEDFSGVDEVRPGNFAFYDVMQQAIGSCDLSQISVAMACPVVAKYPDRNELVIHGGAVHFSKDMIQSATGTAIYGKVVKWENGWWVPEDTGMYIKSLSQEHGIIHAETSQLDSIQIGDVVPVLPVHSCLTADAMKRYVLRDGTVIPMIAY